MSSYIVFSVVCLNVCLRFAICLDNLPWDAIKRIKSYFQLQVTSTLTSVLSILLLDLGKVLKLDSFSLKYRPFHVLDQFLLLLAEKLVLELHSVDFFPHSHDLSLTNGWIKSILHFFFKLDFTLPQEDLALSLNYFTEDVTFLILKVGDFHLESDGLVLQFLKFLHEFFLDVVVIVGQLVLCVGIAVEEIVQLVHLEGLVLEGDLKLSDSLVMRFNLRVKSKFLLVQDRLFGQEIIIVTRIL